MESKTTEGGRPSINEEKKFKEDDIEVGLPILSSEDEPDTLVRGELLSPPVQFASGE